MNTWFGLSGVTCVFAGSSGLLGKACVAALRECGAEVIEVDRTAVAAGGSYSVDLTDEVAVKALFEKLESRAQAGTQWVFINGSYPRTANWAQLRFENVTLEDWNANLALHLGSFFLFTQQSVEFLKRRGGGGIINFGSIYGSLGPDLSIYQGTQMGNPSPYAAIKAGISGLTRYVATVYGKDGIRANTVSPGGVKDQQPQSFVEAYNSKTPLNRMAEARDIAGAVAFLAGPSARYISGQELLVDGGWSAW